MSVSTHWNLQHLKMLWNCVFSPIHVKFLSDLQVDWKIVPCAWMWWSMAMGRPKDISMISTWNILLCSPNRLACTSYTLTSTSPAPTRATAAQGGSLCRWATSSPVKWTFDLRKHLWPGSVGQWVMWISRSCWRRWQYPKLDWPTGNWSWRAPDWECSLWIKVDAQVCYNHRHADLSDLFITKNKKDNYRRHV